MSIVRSLLHLILTFAQASNHHLPSSSPANNPSRVSVSPFHVFALFAHPLRLLSPSVYSFTRPSGLPPPRAVRLPNCRCVALDPTVRPRPTSEGARCAPCDPHPVSRRLRYCPSSSRKGSTVLPSQGTRVAQSQQSAPLDTGSHPRTLQDVGGRPQLHIK